MEYTFVEEKQRRKKGTVKTNKEEQRKSYPHTLLGRIAARKIGCLLQLIITSCEHTVCLFWQWAYEYRLQTSSSHQIQGWKQGKEKNPAKERRWRVLIILKCRFHWRVIAWRTLSFRLFSNGQVFHSDIFLFFSFFFWFLFN